MSERVALLPCPFCGGAAYVDDSWPHHAFCTECGARVTSLKFGVEGVREACEKWNQRKPPQADSAQVVHILHVTQGGERAAYGDVQVYEENYSEWEAEDSD